MSEKLAQPQKQDPTVDYSNRHYYSRYKDSIDRAEKRKAWLDDKSFKGVLNRFVDRTVKIILLESATAETNNDLVRPFETQQDAKKYFKENEVAVKLDAIHDATAAGVELNLPETGLPEAAVHVVELPQQQN